MPVHFDNYSNSPSKHGLSAPGLQRRNQNLKENEETAHLLKTMFGNVRWTFLTKARWMFPPKHKERVHISYIFHCLSLLVHKQLHLAITNGWYLAAKNINVFNSAIAEATRQAKCCSVPPTFSKSDSEIYPSMGAITSVTPISETCNIRCPNENIA